MYIVLVILLILFIIIVYALVDHSIINDRVKKAKDIMDNSINNNIEINKNGYSEKKLTDSIKDKPYDIIFIGSGISSLTCACLLSRKGYKVLVLEQHDRAGGTTHSFIDKGKIITINTIITIIIIVTTIITIIIIVIVIINIKRLRIRYRLTLRRRRCWSTIKITSWLSISFTVIRIFTLGQNGFEL